LPHFDPVATEFAVTRREHDRLSGTEARQNLNPVAVLCPQGYISQPGNTIAVEDPDPVQ
jgi:hypothetical protein